MTEANQDQTLRFVANLTGDETITPFHLFMYTSEEFIAYSGTDYFFDLDEEEKEKRTRAALIRLHFFKKLMGEANEA